jgi:serine/threonine protein phosphatase PrpC
MAFSLRFGAVSDIGRSRRKNDDSGYAGPYLVMVADGMGGAAAGDLASAVAVQTMRRLDAPPPDDLLEALAGAVHRANDRLAELIEEDPAVEGMGTTVSAVLFDGGRIGVAHLGDSRGYLWRDGELLRITHDHTWVQSLIDDGRITEEEAKVHSHRSLLLKVLDGRHDNDPDLTVYDVQPGDRVLLCSDGLSGFVDHDRIERVLGVGDAETAARELLELALEASSTDNITVLVADVVDEPPLEHPEPLVVGSAAEETTAGPFARLRTWAHRDQSVSDEHLIDPDIDPEELRYAPREPRRFRWLKRGIATVVVLGLIVALGKWAYDYSQEQFYVAADGDHVAIYKGVQADLPGIDLHHVYETQDLLLTELPTYRRSQVVEGIDADDLDDSRRIVANLMSFAETCADQASSAASASAAATSSQATTTSRPGRTQDTGGQQPSGGNNPGNRPGDGKPAKPSRTPSPTTSATSSSGSPDGGRSGPEECSGATPATGGTTP